VDLPPGLCIRAPVVLDNFGQRCYTGWLNWLRAAGNACPLGKWPALPDAALQDDRAAFDAALSDD